MNENIVFLNKIRNFVIEIEGGFFLFFILEDFRKAMFIYKKVNYSSLFGM